MKNLVLITILLSAFSAQSHLRIGTYIGTDEAGRECSITINEVLFANQLRHPLNERVVVESSMITGSMTLVHLPMIDSDNMTVRPNKNFLTGVMALRTGAINLNLAMSHIPGQEGPSHIELIKDNYKHSEHNEIKVCNGLSFRE